MAVAAGEHLFREEARAHAFSSAPGSVLVRLPRLLSWSSWLVPLVGLVAAITILSMDYARRERVTGVLAPSLGASRITATVTGAVKDIGVTPGEQVSAGQILAVISPDVSRNGGSSVVLEQLASAQKRKEEVTRQVESTNLQHQLRVQRLTGVIAANQLEREALSEQIRIQEEIGSRLAKQADVAMRLAARNLISQRDAEQRQIVRDDARTRTAELRRDLARLDGTVLQARSDLAASERELKLALSRLSIEELEIGSEIAGLRGETSVEVRSPVAGTVDYVAYRPGQVAVEGSLLLSVVPHGSVLRAELFVPSRAIARMKVGEPVRIEYDAFPAEFYGYASGYLSSINETLLDPVEARAFGASVAGPVYRLFAALSSQSVEDDHRRVRLKSGMTFSADIVIEKHALYNWLWRELTRPVRTM